MIRFNPPMNNPFFLQDDDQWYWGIRAAVLGASGFIGRWVAQRLWAHGAKVYLIVRNREDAEQVMREYEFEGDIVRQDLADTEGIQNLLKKIRPSIVFNLTGYGIDNDEKDAMLAKRINVDLVAAMCESVAGCRDPLWRGQDIIQVGSAQEYGNITGNLDEESAPNPSTPYGQSKLAGTLLLGQCAKAYGLKSLTARLFTVYGPGEHAHRLLPSLMQTANRDRPLLLTSGRQKRDFTYVEDVAEGLLRLGLAKARPGEIVNLATGQLTTVRRFVQIASEVLSIPGERLLFDRIPTRADEMAHDNLTLNRLREITDWVPTTQVRDGILKTLKFEQTHASMQA